MYHFSTVCLYFYFFNTTNWMTDFILVSLYGHYLYSTLGFSLFCLFLWVGTYPPTKGHAEINGWNIKTHLKEARANLGLCPQHNTLFTDLTVKEHLVFFARVKMFPIVSIPPNNVTLRSSFRSFLVVYLFFNLSFGVK